jgi:hypothetical protein
MSRRRNAASGPSDRIGSVWNEAAYSLCRLVHAGTALR